MKTRKSLLLRQLLLAATLAFGFGAIWNLVALVAGTLVLEASGGTAPDWPHRELAGGQGRRNLAHQKHARGKPTGRDLPRRSRPARAHPATR